MGDSERYVTTPLIHARIVIWHFKAECFGALVRALCLVPSPTNMVNFHISGLMKYISVTQHVF